MSRIFNRPVLPIRGEKSQLGIATFKPYELIVTTDTREIYQADQHGVPTKLSDVYVQTATPPVHSNVLWVDRNTNELKFHDGVGWAVISAGSGSGGGLTISDIIDDLSTSTSKTYSSDKIATLLLDKMDKVTGATLDNLASFDSSGNVKDSGVKPSDFASSIHTHTVSDVTDFSTEVNTIIDTEKGTSIAELDATGKLKLSQLPDVSGNSTYVVLDDTERLALTGLNSGDKAFQTSDKKGYIYDGASWILVSDAQWENINLDWANLINKPVTDADLTDAISKKHDHTNKALLDTYNQTNADLTDAVSKKHEHTNKTVIDKFSESGGVPLYDGNSIGAQIDDTTSATTTTYSSSKINSLMSNAGSGDMVKSIYDADNNGIVDTAESLSNGVNTVTTIQAKNAVDKAHEHTNSTTLDKLNDTSGKLTYNGNEFLELDDTTTSTTKTYSSTKIESELSGKADSVHNHNLADLSDVDNTNIADNRVLAYDSVTGSHKYIDSSASVTFKDLGDTPTGYTGNSGKGLKVNATEDALEYTDLVSIDDTTTSTTKTYSSDKVESLVNFAKVQTLVFVFPNTVDLGVSSYVMEFPDSATIKEIRAFTPNPSTIGDSALTVEQTSHADFISGGLAWAGIGNSTLTAGSYSATVSATGTVNASDKFRINFTSVATGLENVTVMLKLEVN